MELNNWAAELDFKKLMIQELQDTIDNLHVQVTELKIEVAKSKQQADEAIKANDAMQNDPQLTKYVLPWTLGNPIHSLTNLLLCFQFPAWQTGYFGCHKVEMVCFI